MPLQNPRTARKLLARKLKEGTFIWGTPVVLAALWLSVCNVLPLSSWISPVELKDRVRWYGILLEVCSILTIVYELNNALFVAGRRPLFKAAWEWLAEWRYVFVRGKVINATVNITLGADTALITAVVRSPVSGTVEEQLAKLKAAIESIDERVSTLGARVEASDLKFQQMLEKETTERERDLSMLRGAIEEQYFGDVRLQVAALAVLILSIFFANAPDESALLFRLVGLGAGNFW